MDITGSLHISHAVLIKQFEYLLSAFGHYLFKLENCGKEIGMRIELHMVLFDWDSGPSHGPCRPARGAPGISSV